MLNHETNISTSMLDTDHKHQHALRTLSVSMMTIDMYMGTDHD
jgi:hypothetical protein